MTDVGAAPPGVPVGMASTMSESGAADVIKSFLEGGADENGEPFMDGAARVSTFRDAGVLSGNAGLVVSLPGGAEFQVTVVRSR